MIIIFIRFINNNKDNSIVSEPEAIVTSFNVADHAGSNEHQIKSPAYETN